MSDHGHGHAASHAPEPVHHAPKASHHHEESHSGSSNDGGEGLLGIGFFFCGIISLFTGVVSNVVDGILECNLVGELLDGGGGSGGNGDHGHGH